VPYKAIMSSFVACLLAVVAATLSSTPARSAAELVGSVGIDVAVTDSTPTKLPKSVSDDLASGSGDASTTSRPRTVKEASVLLLL